MSRTNLLEYERIERERKRFAQQQQAEADRATMARLKAKAQEDRILGVLIGLARKHKALNRSTLVLKAWFMRLEAASMVLLQELETEGLAAIAVEDAAEKAAGVPVIIRFPRQLSKKASAVMVKEGLTYAPVSGHWEGIIPPTRAVELAASNEGKVEYPAGAPAVSEIEANPAGSFDPLDQQAAE